MPKPKALTGRATTGCGAKSDEGVSERRRLLRLHVGRKPDEGLHPVTLHPEPGVDLQGELAVPSSAGKHAAILLLTNAASAPPDSAEHKEMSAEIRRLVDAAGNVVLAVTPRPSPPGTEETKAPILGVFYLSELRAELVGKTLMGMRIDDTIHALNFLAVHSSVDVKRILGESDSGPFWVGTVTCCCARSPVVAHYDRSLLLSQQLSQPGGSTDANWRAGRYSSRRAVAV